MWAWFDARLCRLLETRGITLAEKDNAMNEDKCVCVGGGGRVRLTWSETAPIELAASWT